MDPTDSHRSDDELAADGDGRPARQMIEDTSLRRPFRWAARQIVALRWWSMAIGVAVMLVAYPVSRRMTIQRSITAMFDASDPTLVDYRNLQDAFGGNAVVMLVYRDHDFESVAGFRRNQEISQRVAEIAGVKEQGILSPSVLSAAVGVISPRGFLAAADPTPPLIRPDDAVAQGFDELFAGYTHSADHTRAAVVAMLESDYSPDTIGQFKRLAGELSTEYGPAIDEVSLVGEPVLVHDGFELIERDGARLAFMTVGLLSVVVLVSLVDLRFALLMAVIIAWSVTVTKAVMVLLGISLSLVSTILTAIVTVIAVAAVLHLGVRYRTSRSRGYTLRQSAERTIAPLILPIFWTCATDAAGFAALYGSTINPVRHFGLMVAVAAGCVCLAVALFSPLIMMLPGVRFVPGVHRTQRRLATALRRRCLYVAQLFVRRRRITVAMSTVAIMVAIVGTLGVETETSFLRNFRSTSPIVRDYDKVERDFGGAGVWDVVLPAPETLTEDYLAQVRGLESELRQIEVDGDRLTKVLSLADADQIASRSRLLKLATPSIRLSGMQMKIPVFFAALLTGRSEQRELRIMLRSKEHLGAQQKMRLIGEVEQSVAAHTSDAQWREVAPNARPGVVTGYYVMMARLVESLVADQWRCFLVSGLLVWVLLLAATGSVRLATAALLPNLLPIFLVLAAVGLTGGKINMGATMIAAVSIGLSIDGSVHFLASYRRHRRHGHPATTSAIHAAGGIGVPVLLATVALVIGFSVLATSEFVPTATFGMLVAATLTAGTLINLTLLPAVVATVDR